MFERMPWPEIQRGEIQIWTAQLSGWRDREPELASILSSADRSRLRGYRFPDKRNQFLISRGLLRLILGSYLGSDPRRVEILTQPTGKPYLAGQELTFSLSHSGDWTGFAFSKFQSIGFDLQEIYPVSSLDRVLRKTFSRPEIEYLERIGKRSDYDHFFDLWTAKEAYLKALGDGFRGSAQSPSILPCDDQPGEFQVIGSDMPAGPEQSWIIRNLEIIKGYKSAVAVQGKIKVIQAETLTPTS